MGIINPVSTTTITPRRPTEDFGDETWTDLAPIEAVVSLATPYRAVTEVQSRFLQAGTVFVPQGADLKANDTFIYHGHTFRVQGWPRGDQPHPFTGDEFGWVAYTIIGMS